MYAVLAPFLRAVPGPPRHDGHGTRPDFREPALSRRRPSIAPGVSPRDCDQRGHRRGRARIRCPGRTRARGATRSLGAGRVTRATTGVPAGARAEVRRLRRDRVPADSGTPRPAQGRAVVRRSGPAAAAGQRALHRCRARVPKRRRCAPLWKPVRWRRAFTCSARSTTRPVSSSCRVPTSSCSRTSGSPVTWRGSASSPSRPRSAAHPSLQPISRASRTPSSTARPASCCPRRTPEPGQRASTSW